MESKYKALMEIVKRKSSCSAHNMSHVMRLYGLCLLLAEGRTEVNLDILKMCALLHDVAKVKEDADSSGKIDHALLGGRDGGGYFKKYAI